jgi:2-phosphoglycerate kinase
LGGDPSCDHDEVEIHDDFLSVEARDLISTYRRCATEKDGAVTDQNRPAHRVILIGGTPGAGKTTLCLAVARRLGISSMSFDDLHAGIRGLTSPESHPDLHRTGRGHHVEYFTTTPGPSLVEDALIETAAMWPGMERMILRRANVGPDAVIDSWMLRPSLVATLHKPNVRAVWIHVDPDVLVERERRNTEFLRGSQDPDRMFENFIHRSLEWNELMAAEAHAEGMPLLVQDGTIDIGTSVEQVLTVLGS